ncbi:E3 ubiquitin-protein ligase LRSAM1-like isoform X2 [Thrips palmi]|uniref:E3 ubiquitin-protein ligase LRSAM1-like isoform X2 n=1 Tax=Thrips palmi TaxID=161013 RepID=A0A6P9AI41_THRPL|nr:E3 ubiquitin-protein ligase LRSAM1-like isoform X2 [Thrips palmi]
MPLFRKKGNEDQVNKSRLEHKLYLARENPEPCFDLSDCALRDVPAGIYSLCKVFRKESLFLQDNQLSSLDGGGNLRDLAMLTVLDLQNNCFSVLPDGISFLVNLRMLNLNNNKLTNLPDCFTSVNKLQSLEVAQNQLRSIPESLCWLPHLTKLDLRENSALTLRKLPPTITQTPMLETLLMDDSQLSCVPEDIRENSTQSILAFFAEENGMTYIPPEERQMPGPNKTDMLVNVFEAEKQQRGFKAQKQKERMILEADRGRTYQREFETCSALKENRDRLLAHLAVQQTKLEQKVEKLQQQREEERHRLIQHLQDVERNTDAMITQLLLLSAQEREQERQDKLQRAQEEEQELLAAMQRQHRDLQRHDVLDGMKQLVEEELKQEKRMREYEQCRVEMTNSLLSKELESSNILLCAVDRYSSAQLELVQRLQRDEELQKAAVCSLLERSDARTWGLVQQVALVEQQLAQLTALELQRRNHQLSEQLSDLAEKRTALSSLLVHLLEEQASRRDQLIHTLNEMERQRQDNSDFWLHQYQRLLDSRPNKFIDKERVLDPILANHLVLNGVVHCLPFLVQWMHDPDSLLSVTDSQLKVAGIRSEEDRQKVLRALKLYVEERECAILKLSDFHPSNLPSAPVEEASAMPQAPSTSGVLEEADFNVPKSIIETECVICMESACDVIILQCGHMCCCAKCCEPLNNCPMCRGDIERKIRVRAP